MLRVSVIIPTYNRLDRLKRVITALEQQRYPLDQVEVIIVSDGSTDGTAAYLETVASPLAIKPVLQANQGVAAARNHGIACASGDLVVFIDDDVVPTPALIAEHIRIHAEQAADVVVLGPMLSPPDFLMSPWVRWEQAMLMKQYDAMVAGRWRPSPRQFYTGNASLKRQRLIAAGGFNEAFRRAEDVELAYRLAEHGLSFVFNPQAIGYHYAERSFRSWLDIPYAYGRNDVIFWRDKHQDWLLPQINREFHRRNTLIRVLVHLCVGRARRTASALAVLTFAVHMSARLRIWRAAHLLYSSIFNVRYYQGLADELGGRASFLAHVS